MGCGVEGGDDVGEHIVFPQVRRGAYEVAELLLHLGSVLSLDPGLGKDKQGAQRADRYPQVMDGIRIGWVVDKGVVAAGHGAAGLADGTGELVRALPALHLGALCKITEVLGAAGGVVEGQHANSPWLEGHAGAAARLRDLVERWGMADQHDELVRVLLSLEEHGGGVAACEDVMLLVAVDAQRGADDVGGLAGAQGRARPDDDIRALLDEVADGCELSGQARGERVLAGGGQRPLKIGLSLLRETGLAMSNEYERTSHRDPS